MTDLETRKVDTPAPDNSYCNTELCICSSTKEVDENETGSCKRLFKFGV